nr:MFS transporter [Hymenobacter persicinus]
MPAADSVRHDPYAALRVADFRRLISARVCFTVATRVQGLVVSWQIFKLTGDPLALGFIGLAEALPSIGVSLYAGHLADSVRRKNIIVAAVAVLLLCAGALWALASPLGLPLLARGSFYTLPLYVVIFISGIARGFLGPALFSFMPQLLPDREKLSNAITWNSTTYQASSVLGPAVGGYLVAHLDVANSYAVAAGAAAGAAAVCGYCLAAPAGAGRRKAGAEGKRIQRPAVYFQQSARTGRPGPGYVCRAFWGRRGPAAGVCRGHPARRSRRAGPSGSCPGRGLGADGRAADLLPALAQRGPQAALGRGRLRSGYHCLRPLHRLLPVPVFAVSDRSFRFRLGDCTLHAHPHLHPGIHEGPGVGRQQHLYRLQQRNRGFRIGGHGQVHGRGTLRGVRWADDHRGSGHYHLAGRQAAGAGPDAGEEVGGVNYWLSRQTAGFLMQPNNKAPALASRRSRQSRGISWHTVY